MMSNARRIHLAPRAACALVLSCALAACGATVGSLPEKLGGLPESAPQRPAETMPFPNVYEPRPKRQATPLNDDEQKKLELELTKLRDDQNQRATAPEPAAYRRRRPRSRRAGQERRGAGQKARHEGGRARAREERSRMTPSSPSKRGRSRRPS